MPKLPRLGKRQTGGSALRAVQWNTRTVSGAGCGLSLRRKPVRGVPLHGIRKVSAPGSTLLPKPPQAAPFNLPGELRMSRSDSALYVAFDYADPADARALIDRLDPRLCGVKIGKELFTAGGPVIVDYAVSRGFDVFLDLKFHDIPNTVAQACLAAARLGVGLINVHALGGRRAKRWKLCRSGRR